jgi:hypothetical protein
MDHWSSVFKIVYGDKAETSVEIPHKYSIFVNNLKNGDFPWNFYLGIIWTSGGEFSESDITMIVVVVVMIIIII